MITITFINSVLINSVLIYYIFCKSDIQITFEVLDLSLYNTLRRYDQLLPTKKKRRCDQCGDFKPDQTHNLKV